MRILLLGSGGMLGSDMNTVFTERGHHVVALTKDKCDILDSERVKSYIQGNFPVDAVVNCAGYTKVDDSEVKRDKAFSLNEEGVKRLALVTHELNIPLVHFSTDYVFDGKKKKPYVEDDETSPINIYGESKLGGEKAIQAITDNYYIFRIQWLYGAHGKNFVETMIKLAKNRDQLKVVNDQFGSPTWTRYVALALIQALEHKIPKGIYHLHNDGYTTWHEFASYFLSAVGVDIPVLPVESTEFPSLAERPANGQLDMKKFLSLDIYKPPKWNMAVREFLAISPPHGASLK